MQLYKTEIFGSITIACYQDVSSDAVGYDYRLEVTSDHPAQKPWGRNIFYSATPPDKEVLDYLYVIHNKVIKYVKKKIRKRTSRLLRNVRYKKLYDAQDGKCYLCDLPLSGYDCTIDHVLPVSKGGKDSLRNILLTHGKCNHDKGNRLPTRKELDYLAEVLARVKKIQYLKYHH